MASSDDQVIIISQLLKSMMQTMDYFQVFLSIRDDVKEIAKEVHLNKERFESIEASVRPLLDGMKAMDETLNNAQRSYTTQAMQSSNRMKTIEDRMASIENTLTTMKETLNNAQRSYTTQTKQSSNRMKTIEDRLTSFENTFITMNETLNYAQRSYTTQAMQSSNRMKTIEDRMASIGNTFITMNETLNNVKENHTTQAMQSSDGMKTIEDRLTSFENTFITMNETLNNVKENHANFENTLKAIEETNSQMNTMLKGTPRYGYTPQFDAEYKGKNVIFSKDFRTAERTKPTEDPGHASVVSNSLLEEDEVFQFRIDEVVDQFSDGGIGIGVIKEKKEGIKDARFITGSEDINGTWGIQSIQIRFRVFTDSGKCDTYKDGKRITIDEYPLSTTNLPVGTLLGVSRRRNGSLHFYINGVDKGPAFVNVPKDVYAYVDVVNYVTKISITN